MAVDLIKMVICSAFLCELAVTIVNGFTFKRWVFINLPLKKLHNPKIQIFHCFVEILTLPVVFLCE